MGTMPFLIPFLALNSSVAYTSLIGLLLNAETLKEVLRVSYRVLEINSDPYAKKMPSAVEK